MKTASLILLMLLALQSFAGDEGGFRYSSLAAPKKKQSTFDRSRILLGPGLGFGAAYRTFSFNVSPSVAYCFTDRFHAGASLGFNYFQYAEDYTNNITGQLETYRYKLPAYSMSVFARYLIGDFLILGVEPEVNNTKFVKGWNYSPTTGKIIENSQRLMVGSLMVGGGYTQRFSELGYGYVMVYYDLVQNPNARYYQTLDIRTGIMLQLWP